MQKIANWMKPELKIQTPCHLKDLLIAKPNLWMKSEPEPDEIQARTSTNIQTLRTIYTSLEDTKDIHIHIKVVTLVAGTFQTCV